VTPRGTVGNVEFLPAFGFVPIGNAELHEKVEVGSLEPLPIRPHHRQAGDRHSMALEELSTFLNVESWLRPARAVGSGHDQYRVSKIEHQEMKLPVADNR
jgi:hypothetical protein